MPDEHKRHFQPVPIPTKHSGATAATMINASTSTHPVKRMGAVRLHVRLRGTGQKGAVADDPQLREHASIRVHRRKRAPVRVPVSLLVVVRLREDMDKRWVGATRQPGPCAASRKADSWINSVRLVPRTLSCQALIQLDKRLRAINVTSRRAPSAAHLLKHSKHHDIPP